MLLLIRKRAATQSSQTACSSGESAYLHMCDYARLCTCARVFVYVMKGSVEWRKPLNSKAIKLLLTKSDKAGGYHPNKLEQM